jgi:hypothetical protein
LHSPGRGDIITAPVGGRRFTDGERGLIEEEEPCER